MAKEDYLEIEQDIIDFIKSVERQFNIPIDITYKYVVNRKQKQLIKFTKIPDLYANESLLNADIVAVINDEYFDNFDDETKKILIEKEFDRIDFNFEKGIIKITNPKINVNKGFVEKHTWNRVSDALRLEEEFEQQRKDNLKK